MTPSSNDSCVDRMGFDSSFETPAPNALGFSIMGEQDGVVFVVRVFPRGDKATVFGRVSFPVVNPVNLKSRRVTCVFSPFNECRCGIPFLANRNSLVPVELSALGSSVASFSDRLPNLPYFGSGHSMLGVDPFHKGVDIISDHKLGQCFLHGAYWFRIEWIRRVGSLDSGWLIRQHGRCASMSSLSSNATSMWSHSMNRSSLWRLIESPSMPCLSMRRRTSRGRMCSSVIVILCRERRNEKSIK